MFGFNYLRSLLGANPISSVNSYFCSVISSSPPSLDISASSSLDESIEFLDELELLSLSEEV